MLPVTNIVGRNDRNVGGLQLQPGLGDRTGGAAADSMLPGLRAARTQSCKWMLQT